MKRNMFSSSTRVLYKWFQDRRNGNFFSGAQDNILLSCIIKHLITYIHICRNLTNFRDILR